MIHNRLKFTSQLIAARGWMVRGFDLAFESNRVSILAMSSYCLATLMSSDRTKQICLWMTIYTYIWIYIYIYIYIYIFTYRPVVISFLPNISATFFQQCDHFLTNATRIDSLDEPVAEHICQNSQHYHSLTFHSPTNST